MPVQFEADEQHQPAGAHPLCKCGSGPPDKAGQPLTGGTRWRKTHHCLCRHYLGQILRGIFNSAFLKFLTPKSIILCIIIIIIII